MQNTDVCFDNLSFDNIMDKSEIYSKVLNDKKIVGFKKINLLDQEHEIISKKITNRNDLHWVKKYNHHNLYQPDIKTLTKKQTLDFIKWCMHVDVTPITDSAENILDDRAHTAYVSMNMKVFNCSSSYGKTIFLDLIKLNNACPNDFKKKLSNSKIQYNIAKSKDFDIDAPPKTLSNLDQSDSDLEIAIAKAKVNPLPGIFYPFRTHPVTGETILFWPNYKSSELIDGPKEWFDEFKQWVKEYLDEETNWYSWEWSQGDILIFDNRCMLHSFTPGWKPEDRIFSQIILGYDKPYFKEFN